MVAHSLLVVPENPVLLRFLVGLLWFVSSASSTHGVATVKQAGRPPCSEQVRRPIGVELR